MITLASCGPCGLGKLGFWKPAPVGVWGGIEVGVAMTKEQEELQLSGTDSMTGGNDCWGVIRTERVIWTSCFKEGRWLDGKFTGFLGPDFDLDCPTTVLADMQVSIFNRRTLATRAIGESSSPEQQHFNKFGLACPKRIRWDLQLARRRH